MKERPILFSGPMVRALIAGTKTQTRRICKPQPEPYEWPNGQQFAFVNPAPGYLAIGIEAAANSWICPYGSPGDELFVKETWRTKSQWDALKPSDLPIANEFMVSPFIAYDADGPSRELHGKTRPSIFMPRWASRITLEIVSVRVERLQDISEEDAISEGIEQFIPSAASGLRGGWWKNYCARDGGALTEESDLAHGSPIESYRSLWESINGKGSWALNPWVWVITFKRV